MSSIPLPALDLKPPQTPDVAGQFGNLLRLRALQQQMGQQQAEAPLRQQILQNQAQTTNIAAQTAAQGQKDQKAMTAAMQQWDGKDLNGLVPLVVKNGASANAVIGLKQKVLEQKKQASDIAASDATTGSKNVATMMQKNDMISGALSTVLQTPDAQLPQAVMATAQDLAQKGLLDPQHVQMAEKIAQSGNPAQIRTQLDAMRKGMMANSQILAEAQKTAQAANHLYTDPATKQQFYGEIRPGQGIFNPASGQVVPNAAPSPSASGQSMFSMWMAEHPGKTVDDYMRLQNSMKPEFPRVVPVNDAKGNVTGYNLFSGTGGGVKTEYIPVSKINGLPQNLGGAPGVIPPKPTASVLTQSQRAAMIQPQVDALNNQIDATTKYLGPLSGRWSDVMAGKIGANNPAVAKLQMQLQMFTTALMLAHGLRGEQYEKNLSKYLSAAQSPANLKARIEGADAYLQDYAGSTGHGPGGNPPPANPGGGSDFFSKFGGTAH